MIPPAPDYTSDSSLTHNSHYPNYTFTHNTAHVLRPPSHACHVAAAPMPHGNPLPRFSVTTPTEARSPAYAYPAASTSTDAQPPTNHMKHSRMCTIKIKPAQHVSLCYVSCLSLLLPFSFVLP